ncbi:MAG: hypothetical protein DMG07_24500 [Acidobacteria bacterium]|nr:MAG: hypothetical protein DMG07_24500 [Acidobacteriota bacterium]
MRWISLALGLLSVASPISVSDPAYPPNAVAGAAVVAGLDVRGGLVSRVEILGGSEPFAAAARQALAGWRFPPSVARARVAVVVCFSSPNLTAATRPAEYALPTARSGPEMPFPVRIVEPGYPPDASGGGAVTLRLQVDAAGAVQKVESIKTLGSFTEAATAAVSKWRFALFRPPVIAPQRPK